jgi:DNA-binding response OmpR family regulator
VASVLVIDDDPGTREAIRLVLERFGHEVIEVADGIVDRERRIDADVVLLDLKMPDVDGFEVLGWFRRFVQVPVIVCTGEIEYGGRPLDEVARELGASYLSKPFNVDRLVAAVEDALRSRERAPALQP